MSKWKKIIKENINLNFNEKYKFPLNENIIDKEDIVLMIEVLMSGYVTMGKKVLEFEKKFAKYLGVKYAIMVNSGSSANLLAMSAAINLSKKNRLKKGDKILVPAVCWSTSVWPILQCGLIPVFVDVSIETMNIDLLDLKEKLKDDIKGIVLVHILGNCTNMDELMKIVKENNLFLLEDTCESLGSRFDDKFLGTFGNFGTFSFYYSHHITTIEGGMVVCNNDDDYEILKSLRAHGWIRDLKKKEEYIKEFKEIDSRFMFVNLGYNFRPMEIQGAIGLNQLKKLEFKNSNRNYNRNQIVNKIINSKKNIYLECINNLEKVKPAWFELPFIIKDKYKYIYKEYLEYLTNNGVENRPLVTGNFTRQPVFKLLGIDLDIDPKELKGADIIHFQGFFIGLSCKRLDEEKINNLVKILLDYKVK